MNMDQEMKDEATIQPLFTVAIGGEQPDTCGIQEPSYTEDVTSVSPIVITPVEISVKDEDSTKSMLPPMKQETAHVSPDVEPGHQPQCELVDLKQDKESQNSSLTPVSGLDGPGQGKEMHLSDKCQPLRLKCECTKESFKDLEHFRKHIQEYHPCHVCANLYQTVIDDPMSMLSTNFFDSHNSHLHMTGFYPCPFCPCGKSTPFNLLRHVQDAHAQANPDLTQKHVPGNIKCDLLATCSRKSFVKLQDYLDHCNRFHRSTFGYCSQCLSIYEPIINKPLIKAPANSGFHSHRHKSGIYPCPYYCPYAQHCESPYDLLEHVLTIHSVKDLAILESKNNVMSLSNKCTQCADILRPAVNNSTGANLISSKAYIQHDHKSRLYPCPFCPWGITSIFNDKIRLYTHVEEIHKEPTDLYLCPLCPKGRRAVFCTLLDLRNHVGANHVKNIVVDGVTIDPFKGQQKVDILSGQCDSVGECQIKLDTCYLRDCSRDKFVKLQDYVMHCTQYHKELLECMTCKTIYQPIIDNPSRPVTEDYLIMNDIQSHRHETGLYLCPSCPGIRTPFTKPIDLFRHVITTHSKTKSKRVKEQTITTNGKYEVNTDHVTKAQDSGSCNIKNCSRKAFSKQKDYVAHCTKFHQDVFRKCLNCVSAYQPLIDNPLRNIPAHACQHETEIYPCPFCPKAKTRIFNGPQYLRRHIQVIHGHAQNSYIYR